MRSVSLPGSMMILHRHDSPEALNIEIEYSVTWIVFAVAAKDFDMMAYPMRRHGVSDKAAALHLYRKMIQIWKADL